MVTRQQVAALYGAVSISCSMHATCSGVCWSFDGMRGSPPASSSSLTHSCLSIKAARHSGVRPWWFCVLTLAPCFSSSVHTSTAPPHAASERGVWSLASRQSSLAPMRGEKHSSTQAAIICCTSSCSLSKAASSSRAYGGVPRCKGA